MAPAATSAAAPVQQGPTLDDVVNAMNNINLRMESNNNKSLVANPGIFEGTKKVFPTWWRKMRLYLKGNEAKIDTNDRKAMVVLSRLGGKLCTSFAEAKIEAGIEGKTFGARLNLEQEITQKFTEHNVREMSKRCR